MLEKCGVPLVTLSVIRFIHDGMKAEVRAGGHITDNIVVKNGLWQGCTLAPSLFNVYVSTMITHWRASAWRWGCQYCISLAGSLLRTVQRSHLCDTESLFAEGTAMYVTTRGVFDRAASEFVNSASKWGLTVSIQNTKGLYNCRQACLT